MKKFDAKKWIIENKFGKEPQHSNYAGLFGMISEQTGSITGSESGNTETWYSNASCTPCPSGYIVSGGFSGNPPFPIVNVETSNTSNTCGPTISGQPFEINASIINHGNNPSNYDLQLLFPSEIGMGYEEFNAQYGTNRLYDNPNSGMLFPFCGEDSNTTFSGDIVFQGVCCDQNAQNYGQTNIQGYNIQQDEANALDNALMQNLLDQGYCDNSICDDGSFDDTINPNTDPEGMGLPSPDSGKGKLDQLNKKQKTDMSNQLKKGRRVKPRPVKESKMKKSELRKLIKETLKDTLNKKPLEELKSGGSVICFCGDNNQPVNCPGVMIGNKVNCTCCGR
jgi:hypothetical protein